MRSRVKSRVQADRESWLERKKAMLLL